MASIDLSKDDELMTLLLNQINSNKDEFIFNFMKKGDKLVDDLTKQIYSKPNPFIIKKIVLMIRKYDNFILVKNTDMSTFDFPSINLEYDETIAEGISRLIREYSNGKIELSPEEFIDGVERAGQASYIFEDVEIDGIMTRIVKITINSFPIYDLHDEGDIEYSLISFNDAKELAKKKYRMDTGSKFV